MGNLILIKWHAPEIILNLRNLVECIHNTMYSPIVAQLQSMITRFEVKNRTSVTQRINDEDVIIYSCNHLSLSLHQTMIIGCLTCLGFSRIRLYWNISSVCLRTVHESHQGK